MKKLHFHWQRLELFGLLVFSWNFQKCQGKKYLKYEPFKKKCHEISYLQVFSRNIWEQSSSPTYWYCTRRSHGAVSMSHVSVRVSFNVSHVSMSNVSNFNIDFFHKIASIWKNVSCHSGDWGERFVHEKSWRSKISWHCLFPPSVKENEIHFKNIF